MPITRLIIFISLAMLAFAGNSLLCRLALKTTSIDAASFTSLRLASGALVLWFIVRWRNNTAQGQGNWLSALALLTYAAGFSWAYRELPAATGALILFGAVQATMIGHGLWRGERLHGWQWLGLLCAFAGLIGLFLPGLTAPPLFSALLMLTAGIAWGVYSLRGRGAGDATKVTAGNFLRAVPLALLLSVLTWQSTVLDASGTLYAIASGAIASGMGYALWYAILPYLPATQAATLQLSVPVLTTIGGVVWLDEALSWRIVLASAAILGGIALVIRAKITQKVDEKH